MESRDSRTPKFKRCKISRPQLTVLMQHFDDDPLPSFEKRQAIANRLGMTPRSVQIWFQNRRQRLLKPLRQAGVPEGDLALPQGREGSLSSGSSDSGEGTVSYPESSFSDIQDQHSSMPMMPPHNIFAPLLHEAANALPNASPPLGAHLPGGLSLPVQGSGFDSQLPGQPNLLAMLQKALMDRQLPPSVAALLAQALQSQITGNGSSSGAASGCTGLPALEAAAHQQCANFAGAASAAPSSSPSTPSPRASSPPVEGVDGLLLLSACADAQRPATQTMCHAGMPLPNHSKSAAPGTRQSMISSSIASLITPTMAMA